MKPSTSILIAATISLAALAVPLQLSDPASSIQTHRLGNARGPSMGEKADDGGRQTWKSNLTITVAAIAFFIALAIPSQPAGQAQQVQGQKRQVHADRYRSPVSPNRAFQGEDAS